MIIRTHNDEFYPLMFSPVLKEMIWGGTLLSEKFGRVAASSFLGESWDISCHENGESHVINGAFKGNALKKLVARYPLEILGTNFESYNDFPLLIKLIHSNDDLSVQVHPDDDYARKHENQLFGKTEMWYILDAEPDAELVYGFSHDVDKERFVTCLQHNNFDRCFNKIKVKSGDSIYIPAGTIHAIGKGIVLCEIQQNSDLTYRVFDWNRLDKDGKPRKLHIEQALDVVNFNLDMKKGLLSGLTMDILGGQKTFLVIGKYFSIEKLTIKSLIHESTQLKSFHTLTVVKGEGELIAREVSTHVKIGDSILIPAILDKYQIQGNCEVIKSYVTTDPHCCVEQIISYGFSNTQITEALGGLDFNI